MSTIRPDIVLVHGGFMGGWCWRRVADRLTDMGARVFAPTLTGMGERSHLMSADITLDAHVTDVVNLIRWEQLDQFVLCGHSYGGMVISAVAEQIAPKIRSLVYLDAYNPLPGASVWDALSDRARRAFETATIGENAVAPGAAGGALVNPGDAGWVNALATPQPRRTLEDHAPPSMRREDIANKLFVRATGYPSKMLDDCARRAAATPGWAHLEVPFAHNVMIDEPDITTELLAGILWPDARSARRPQAAANAHA
jgi:pimeloyl-ACP methyl ester carboxylesterase